MSFLRVSKLPFASLQNASGQLWPPSCTLPTPSCLFLGFQNCRLPALKCFWAALASLLHLANPFMSFLRVSKLPFASPQMLPGSFGLLPAPCQPLHVFSEGFRLPALKCFWAALASLHAPCQPLHVFSRVSKLPLASPQMLPGSFGPPPAPCQPLHVFS